MRHLGIIALINFNDWDNPNYSETGGVNSVIKNIIPFLKADKIILYGITYQKENLFREKKINEIVSVFPIIYKSPKNILPNRILGLLWGWRLKRFLRRHKINFIYSHSEELAFWLPLTGIRYIHHLHTYVNALKVSNGRLSRIRLLQKLWERIRQRVIRNSIKSVAVNREIALMLESTIGKDRIIRFSNYVDPEKFTYKDPSDIRIHLNLGDKKVALFIGRITRVKGMELFVDIVAELNNLDRNNWCGVIVGNGEYESTLKDYIRNQNLNESFIFPGSANTSDELSKYYSLADVFLMTSSSESVGLTMLESLSCGTPVVSTNVGIALDVLGHYNGYVVSSNDKKEMASCAIKSLRYKKRQSILKNAKEYSVEYASNLLNQEFWK